MKVNCGLKLQHDKKLTYGRTQSIDYYKQKELKYIYMKEEIESVSNRNSTCKESVIGFSLYLLGK
jgi:hypothetical protein